MPYIPPDTLAKIKQIDPYTYLKTYTPSELVRISGNVYRMRSHERLKISNGKWMWWSRGIGGRSALDYLIKVEGYSFLEAAELIMSQASLQPPQTVDKVSTGAWLQHHSFCQNTNSHIFYIGNSGSSRNSIL